MEGKVGKREDYKKGEGGMTENMEPPLELHVFLGKIIENVKIHSRPAES
ncbi:hypothetical protein [Peribacillus butanolivorans]